MSDTVTIVLGARTFDVPPLPLRLNIIAYPICQRLEVGGLTERYRTNQGTLICSMEEMADLATIAYAFARAADPNIDQASFDEMHIPPQDLIGAYIFGRVQTGGWVSRPATNEADEPGANDASGEVQGAVSPQT